MLIVDAARMGLPPGDVRFFAPEDVESRKDLAGFSTHEGDVLKVIELARAMGYQIPRLELMGIEPLTTEPGIGLSEPLVGKLSDYVAAAIGTPSRTLNTGRSPVPSLPS